MLDARGLPPYLVELKTAEHLAGTSHYGHPPAGIPAKAGTTNTFLPEVTAFVVPPSGGSAHNDNCRHLGPSRGTGNSYVLIFAPELWPELAADWYARYEAHFWQKTWWAEGWREYPRQLEPEFAAYMDGRLAYDVDAGPIIAGFSPATNAFGLAAATINGRLDHAYTLGTQIIAATWPLPDGSLLGPRILSSQGHAPYLGEACILFFLSQTPHESATIVTGGHTPGCVTIGYVFYFGTGLALLLIAGIGAWRWRRNQSLRSIPCERLQFTVWAGLLIVAAALTISQHLGTATLVLLVIQLFPCTENRLH